MVGQKVSPYYYYHRYYQLQDMFRITRTQHFRR